MSKATEWTSYTYICTVNSFVRIKTFVQQNLNKKIIKEGQKYISYPLQLKPMEINKREKR